jgi:dolichyl-phosphate mannosyltransferase polypeptide 2 regulatory subunit
MLLVAAFVFTYYTTWALLLVCTMISTAYPPGHYPHLSVLSQPFLSSDSPLQPLFPPREWAVRLPAIVLVLGCACVSAFFGNVMLQESRKRKAKMQGKAA